MFREKYSGWMEKRLSISDKDDIRMTTIITDKRSDDYIASIEGDKGKWEAGKNENEAIGKLIISHPKLFNVEIKEKVWK